MKGTVQRSDTTTETSTEGTRERAEAVEAVTQIKAISALQRALDQATIDTADVEPDDLVTQAQCLHDKVMASYPCAIGKALSKKERDILRLHSSEFVYGEISFKSFAAILDKIKRIYGLRSPATGYNGTMQEPGGIFYDIGSGIGKPVFAAVAYHPFERAIGVEMLEGLHMQALAILKRWNDSVQKPLATLRGALTEIDFLMGDFSDLSVLDWREGDIVFANSTCFSDRVMQHIAQLAAGMRKYAFFISLTKRLPSSHFKVLLNEMFNFSWGGATVFIQQKVTDADTNTVMLTHAGLSPNGAEKGD